MSFYISNFSLNLSERLVFLFEDKLRYQEKEEIDLLESYLHPQYREYFKINIAYLNYKVMLEEYSTGAYKGKNSEDFIKASRAYDLGVGYENKAYSISLFYRGFGLQASHIDSSAEDSSKLQQQYINIKGPSISLEVTASL